MFRKNTYITKGINEELNPVIITKLWEKVQSANNRELDYLQVFNLRNIGEPNRPSVEVKWKQEVPEHHETFIIEGVNTDVDRVWIICTAEGTDDEYSTMLLPEEY